MMFMTSSERDFLVGYIRPEMRILEYGSGESTLEMASLCKEIVSVEHQEKWYSDLSKKIPDNCTLLFRPPNLPYSEGKDCGSYEQFKDYVESPLSFGRFDIILIDGRARVSCAYICHLLANEGCKIFVHDFSRNEYQSILGILHLVTTVKDLAMFEVKNELYV